MNPQNAIIGDDNYGTDIPVTSQPEENLEAEKNRAKFSRTKEFKELKSYIEARIEFYSTYLPTGQPITDVTEEERGKYWLVANLVIDEMKMILQSYEKPAEVINDASK